MDKVDYRETQLWADARALILEVYRATSNWPEDGRDLANDLRGVARTIARTVPGAFKRAGIAGNVQLQMAKGSFGELEALAEIAVELGYLEAAVPDRVRELAIPIEAKFRELSVEAKKAATEMMRRRTSFLGGADFDDDEDDF